MIRPPHDFLPNRRHILATLGAAAGAWSASPWPPRLFAADELAGKQLVARSQAPYNAEPELPPLVKDWITPHSLFYVRNHGTIPEIDSVAFRLSVTGLVDRPLSLTLKEVQALADAVTLPATLTCAGNRRREFAKAKAVGGVQWEAGAVGNARWTGLPLAKLLARCGVQAAAKHVWFEGLDACVHDKVTTAFGASIDLARAMAAEPAPALLAWQMNGADLTREHGFPLRTIVPGYIGARSVKWLAKIVVSDRPSPNYFQAVAYKLIETEAQAAAAQPIEEYVLNSVICQPTLGPLARMVPVSGYALPRGLSTKLAKVEVSADGGKNWKPMKLLDDDLPGCWRRFAGEVERPDRAESLLVRAVDSLGTTQPQQAQWNLKGYLYNGWHEVPFAKPGT